MNKYCSLKKFIHQRIKEKSITGSKKNIKQHNSFNTDNKSDY